MDDIEVFPYAISDKPGVREFNGWTEDIDINEWGRGDIHMIEYRTLDSFNFTNVGLIKIDIEGFELFAIRSGIGTIIRNNYPPLLIETWPDANIESFMGEDAPIYKVRKYTLIRLLQDIGYVLIEDPAFGDWETKFFIHKTRLGGYTRQD